jgi:hypothetical protein
VYALSPADDRPLSLEPIRVAVVTLVTTATTERVIAELRRAAMQVEVASVHVLASPPVVPVYVVSVDGTVAGLLADELVAWAAQGAPRPGLIGLVEEGSTSHPLERALRIAPPERALRIACEALLAAGFDDAVCAPVSPRELAGRVRAVHRRVHRKGAPDGRLRYGELTLDLYGRALWVEGKTISLTSIELAVMRELMKARGRPLSRTELLDVAWGDGELEISERAVDNVILRLRRKLPRPDLIETVRNVGFRIASRAP